MTILRGKPKPMSPINQTAESSLLPACRHRHSFLGGVGTTTCRSTLVQDFGLGLDALYLPKEDFDELRSGKTEASLDVGPKSWCIVKLE